MKLNPRNLIPTNIVPKGLVPKKLVDATANIGRKACEVTSKNKKYVFSPINIIQKIGLRFFYFPTRKKRIALLEKLNNSSGLQARKLLSHMAKLRWPSFFIFSDLREPISDAELRFRKKQAMLVFNIMKSKPTKDLIQFAMRENTIKIEDDLKLLKNMLQGKLFLGKKNDNFFDNKNLFNFWLNALVRIHEEETIFGGHAVLESFVEEQFADINPIKRHQIYLQSVKIDSGLLMNERAYATAYYLLGATFDEVKLMRPSLVFNGRGVVENKK